MHEFEISLKLKRILKKLVKKDKLRYEATLKKIEEVCSSQSIEHYKNLSYDLKEFKRVHILSHFVLIFKFDKKTGKIRFEDLQHHSDIYKR
ncbi:MAG: addiction module toxin RelE [Candidatus Diapherotrites archaeon]|nr:addiction module toxin RelE [Candidatus Diapherotrites archaeon]